MRTVVLAYPSAEVYGAAVSMMNHALAMQEIGYDVHVVLCQKGPLENALREKGIPCSVLPILHLGLRRASRLRAGSLWGVLRVVTSRVRCVRDCARMLRQRNRPVLHAHAVPCVYPVLAARLAGCPVVWHVREARWPGSEWPLLRFLVARLSNTVVFVSNGVRRQYRVPERKALTVHNFIELPEARAAGAGSGTAHGVRLAFVGNLCRLKGPDRFIEICGRLKRRGVPFRARIAGDGSPEMLEETARAAAAAGCEAEVEFLGYVTDLSELYRNTDVIVLTSRTDALPRAIMEAMAYGIPAVASNVDGVPEMVDHGTTGFLFDLDRPDEAVAAIQRLALDRGLREEMGRKARERAAHLFSRKAYVERFDTLYSGLLQGR